MAGLDVRRHQVDLPLKAPVSVSVVPLRATLAFLIFHREPRVCVWAKSLCLTLEFLRVVCSPALTQSSRSRPTSDIKETAGAACTLQCRPSSLVGKRRRKNPTARVADSSREKICRPPFPPHNPFMTFSSPDGGAHGSRSLTHAGRILIKVRFTDACCCCKRLLLLLLHYGPHSCTSKLRRQTVPSLLTSPISVSLVSAQQRDGVIRCPYT